MGELMDALTRFAESDDTKDPGEGDDKTGAARKGELHKGHSQFQNRGNNHHGGHGKKRQQEGPTEFVANTNNGNTDPPKKKRGFSGKKPRNYHEKLKGPCPQHAMAEGPATHSWEDSYVMQEFRVEALKRSQGGEQGHQQEQPGASGSRQATFVVFPNQGPQGGSQHNAGQFQVHNQQYHRSGMF
ncbi:hypothetical protein ZWY2020_020335 [Hordeum vulgare]|nr:hypothetical protein ZWY2020_020335 [Hordeum vulgare]